MRKSLAPLLLLSLACGGLGSDDDPTDGPADGLCVGDLEAAMAWEGEYPGPVVQVVDSTMLPRRADPCGPITGECLVGPGLYHPWGVGSGFATVRAVDRYVMSADHTNGEGFTFAKGDTVEVTVYLGEGFCSFRVNGEEMSGECPNLMGDASEFVLQNPEAEALPETQLFQANCAEGGQGWVEVGVALGTPGIMEGVVTGYGSVGEHGVEGF